MEASKLTREREGEREKEDQCECEAVAVVGKEGERETFSEKCLVL